MANVKVLYERKRYDWEDEDPNDFGYGFGDYSPMIYAFGNAVVHESDNDYQGDDYVLYDNEGKIGHLIFGWGSCSGCDSLQACSSWEELQNLSDSLEGSIKWFDSYADALSWFNEHDWEGDWSWGRDKRKDYVEAAIKYLTEKATGLLVPEQITYWGREVFREHMRRGEDAIPLYFQNVVEDRILNEKDLQLIRAEYQRRLIAAISAGDA